MMRLTILRPEPGASASLAMAKELGIEALSVPLFTIEALDWEVPQSAGFDGVLLTSANAIRFGGHKVRELRGLKAFAVGDATAQAAREAGFDIAATGAAGVERLLGSIEACQHLVHLCGEDRVEVRNTSHEIAQIAVYRAAELPPPPGIASAAFVAVHSPRAARRFAQVADELGLNRSRILIAAISKAAAEAAGSGWREVAVASSPDDRSLLALAKELCDKPQGS
ncbi:MAG TPA: uroporphyrinogen-III synthase [Sphingomicrobium sp.]|jgi:uroporphyrinogen-III synthase